MTNVGHTILFKLAKTNRSYHLTCQSLETCSRVIGCLLNCDHQSYCEGINLGKNSVRHPQIQKRFSSNSSREHNTRRDGTQNTSSSHQQHHRQSYERRKTQNARRNKDEQSDSSSGAQPAEQMSHYQRLNIQQDSDSDTIKSAYYSLSKVFHPDIVGIDDPKAVDNFRLITESYDTLKDPQLRAEYDHQLDLVTKEVSLRDMEQSSWQNSDMNLMFRSRNADLIFRAKQEAALQREKSLYPKKFRAGSFVNDIMPDETTSQQMKRLDRHLNYLYSRPNPVDQSSSNFFYRQHLEDTLRRRRASLQESRDWDGDLSSDQSDSDLFIFFGGFFSIFAIFLLFTFVKTDFAAKLDEELYRSREEKIVKNE